MKYEEAKLELNGIIEIHRKSWDKYCRVFMDLNGKIRRRGKDEQPEEFEIYMPRLKDLSCTDWEIYQEPHVSPSKPETLVEAYLNPKRKVGELVNSLTGEPLAMLLGDIYATLNKSEYDDLPQSAKRRVLNFVIEGIVE